MGEVLILLRHCWRDAFFLRLRWQWIVLSRLGVALLSFVWSFDALFVFGLSVDSYACSKKSTLYLGISLTSGVAALLAWFPASWASKIAPCFLHQGGAPQPPQEVTILCPTREAPGMQRDQRARTLQAVRFVDKRAPGFNLGIDEDYQASQCFSEVIRGSGFVS